jgi:hypothetical protein
MLSLCAIALGLVLGILFGANEKGIKGNLEMKAQAVLDSKYEGDTAKMEKTTGKSWVYLKRAHLHAFGLGTAALAMILLLSFLTADQRLKIATAILIGAGSVGYPLYWLLAGLRAPAMGSTGAAKESLAWLAMPSSTAFLLGTISVIVITVIALFVRVQKENPA